MWLSPSNSPSANMTTERRIVSEQYIYNNEHDYTIQQRNRLTITGLYHQFNVWLEREREGGRERGKDMCVCVCVTEREREIIKL